MSRAVKLPSILTWHQFQSLNLLLINNKSLSITKSKSLKCISARKLDSMIILLCLILLSGWALYAYGFTFVTFINHAACICFDRCRTTTFSLSSPAFTSKTHPPTILLILRPLGTTDLRDRSRLLHDGEGNDFESESLLLLFFRLGGGSADFIVIA